MGEPVFDFDWLFIAVGVRSNKGTATRDSGQRDRTHSVSIIGSIQKEVKANLNWAASSEFVSSSIPSWQVLTAHAQPFRGARDLAFCLKVPLDSLLVWASSGGSGETARMRRLAWTFAARIGGKYQIRLTRPNWLFQTYWFFLNSLNLINHKIKFQGLEYNLQLKKVSIISALLFVYNYPVQFAECFCAKSWVIWELQAISMPNGWHAKDWNNEFFIHFKPIFFQKRVTSKQKTNKFWRNKLLTDLGTFEPRHEKICL